MSTDGAIQASIRDVAEAVAPVWPLHSFVTANPLAGFEDRPFHEAVDAGDHWYGGDGYPDAEMLRRAWERGEIDPDRLRTLLADHGFEPDPDASLDRLKAEGNDGPSSRSPDTEAVDAVCTKWLAAFCDEGRADWPMPDRDKGFYRAVKSMAPHDRAIPDGEAIAALPEQPIDAIRDLLEDRPVGEWKDVFAFHLTALPGWTGYIKQRAADGDEWQAAAPITLPGYLAIRLALARQFDAPMTRAAAPESTPHSSEGVPLPAVWLRAWEATYRGDLVEAVEGTAASPNGDRPDAQLVFCIDTRSEVIRRHLEATGDYETHGYAGFFGVPMRYDDGTTTVDACPPIVDAKYRITDRPDGAEPDGRRHDRWAALTSAGQEAVHALKSNAATAFSFVESAGAGYGAALAARTLVPGRVRELLERLGDMVPATHEVQTPSIDRDPDGDGDLPSGLPNEEKVDIAATAFELMGIEEFAPLVAFVGHRSETANNPFDASLDCGACAGNPGGPNARVLAAICNEPAVRDALRERGIDIPADTVFVAGEHNTTTDEVELFDGPVPASHATALEDLRTDLEQAREAATAERLTGRGDADDDGRDAANRRAADWAEPRPEWGLAGNAGFVIGPRSLTADLDLGGRSFLHSYDWSTDPDGEALAGIMTGPLVVAQWINAQYYFATVDNAVYGSGSKVTQNPVGNLGVLQGNGGDLMSGLPSQSLRREDGTAQHRPLRLSTVIHAPIDRVAGVIEAHDEVATLLDNRWLWLTVVEPEQDNRA